MGLLRDIYRLFDFLSMITPDFSQDENAGQGGGLPDPHEEDRALQSRGGAFLGMRPTSTAQWASANKQTDTDKELPRMRFFSSGRREDDTKVTNQNEKEGLFTRFGMKSTKEGADEQDDTHGRSWQTDEKGALWLAPTTDEARAERAERDRVNAQEVAEMNAEAEARYAAERDAEQDVNVAGQTWDEEKAEIDAEFARQEAEADAQLDAMRAEREQRETQKASDRAADEAQEDRQYADARQQQESNDVHQGQQSSSGQWG